MKRSHHFGCSVEIPVTLTKTGRAVGLWTDEHHSCFCVCLLFVFFNLLSLYTTCIRDWKAAPPCLVPRQLPVQGAVQLQQCFFISCHHLGCCTLPASHLQRVLKWVLMGRAGCFMGVYMPAGKSASFCILLVVFFCWRFVWLCWIRRVERRAMGLWEKSLAFAWRWSLPCWCSRTAKPWGGAWALSWRWWLWSHVRNVVCVGPGAGLWKWGQNWGLPAPAGSFCSSFLRLGHVISCQGSANKSQCSWVRRELQADVFPVSGKAVPCV